MSASDPVAMMRNQKITIVGRPQATGDIERETDEVGRARGFTEIKAKETGYGSITMKTVIKVAWKVIPRGEEGETKSMKSKIWNA